MPERYLTGAIQKAEPNAKLAETSARFLQIGCGFTDFQPPTGRRRFSVLKNPFLQKIGTERNGALARELAEEKYHWIITGLETGMDLPDELQNKVTVVRDLGFAPCQYRLGVSALAFGVETLEEWQDLIKRGLRIPHTLEELRDGTRIATKHVNLMERIIRQRGLNLAVVHDDTPETAPEFRRIYIVADNFESGETWATHNIAPGEVFLEPHAVLVKARRLPWGIGRIFNNEFLPRVDQALANPELWINPSILSNPVDNDSQDPKKEPARNKWDFRGLIPGLARGVVVSTMLFTLLGSSAILNPWHSETSKEKDLKS